MWRSTKPQKRSQKGGNHCRDVGWKVTVTGSILRDPGGWWKIKQMPKENQKKKGKQKKIKTYKQAELKALKRQTTFWKQDFKCATKQMKLVQVKRKKLVEMTVGILCCSAKARAPEGSLGTNSSRLRSFVQFNPLLCCPNSPWLNTWRLPQILKCFTWTRWQQVFLRDRDHVTHLCPH